MLYEVSEKKKKRKKKRREVHTAVRVRKTNKIKRRKGTLVVNRKNSLLAISYSSRSSY